MAAALFKVAPGGPRPHPLALEPEAALVEEPAAPPVAPLGDPRTTRYAGAFLLYAALARVDLWGVFRRLAVTTGPARWYGWAHTVAAIVCGFGLRFRSIEDLKNALRADLGVLLGTAQAPTVLVLRQKIKALAESVVPVALARALFRRYVALEPVWEGVYYVDGHFCPYYGQHSTPQGWNPHRRLAVQVTRMSTSTMRAGACCFSSRRRSHTPSKPCSVIPIRTRLVSSATGRSFTSPSPDPLIRNGDVLDPVTSEL